MNAEHELVKRIQRLERQAKFNRVARMGLALLALWRR